jgi:probable F420-dependent oxidoreductase
VTNFVAPAAPDLGSVGLWRTSALLTPALAAAAETMGYGTIWVGGSPPADLVIAERILDATESVAVATGIVNIWESAPDDVADSFHRLERSHPGRFILGIGIGHREALGAQYRKPFDALTAYLDVLDARGVPAQRRLISALGPRTLKLAAERAAGTHPYMTTPAHTRYARELLGPDSIIAPEQRLVLDPDATTARATSRSFVAGYLSLANYRRTLESHGFSPHDLTDGGTDAAVDALAPHGSAVDLALAVRGHLYAGADHVCVQFLPARTDPSRALEFLSNELGLT